MHAGSLFAGIGGFELGFSRAGITPLWSNEKEAFPCKVLRKNFDHRIIEDDIRNIGKGRKHQLEAVDIICGGFPCQPFSNAGKREGRNDNRYLWPEMLRVIQEVRPKWIVGENVPGILTLEDGAVFEEICTSLETEGYQVQAFNIPACAVRAAHRRQRIWIIAHYDKINFNLARSQSIQSSFEQEEAIFRKLFAKYPKNNTKDLGVPTSNTNDLLLGGQAISRELSGEAGKIEGEAQRKNGQRSRAMFGNGSENDSYSSSKRWNKRERRSECQTHNDRESSIHAGHSDSQRFPQWESIPENTREEFTTPYQNRLAKLDTSCNRSLSNG